MRDRHPREIKPLEGRVALVPEACGELVRLGHRVLVQRGAGEGSGFADAAYEAAGAVLVPDAESLYGEARLVVKVKEPWGPELDLLRPEHRLFSFLHLAAEPELTRRLCEIGLTAVGFETVEEAGALPILAPMSDIAGRLAVQIGTTLLHAPEGGKGLLLGGMATAERGRGGDHRRGQRG
jgi:alanine dehydrogenase